MPTHDPIESALREADLLAEQEADAKSRKLELRRAWRWLMEDPRGRLIANRLIEAAQHDDEFSSNFGMMSWKFSRAAFVREHIVRPMRDTSLELFHLMERENHDEH